MHLSLRWRLTLWNTLALAVILLGFAVLVYGLLNRALYQQIDRNLWSEFQEMGEDHRLRTEGEARLRHLIAESKEHENYSIVVYDAEGRVVALTKELAAESVPPAPAIGPGETRFHDANLPAGGRQRCLAGQVRPGDSEWTLVMMAPLEEVDRELGQLLRVFGMAVPMALILSGGLGFFLAGKSLRPMAELQRRTEEITADRLDHRLPVADRRDELGRLATTINAMIARLERSFAEVRRFTADASHELRTPLTAIRTEAEVALTRPLTLEEHQQLLGSILEECERLTRLTDQLLTLSREDAGTVQQTREPVDLTALVREVVDTLRPLAEAKGLPVKLVADVPLPIQGDEARLRQVFFNLVDNAIKYTPPGGAIEVQTGERDGAAVVSVRDSGVGIPTEHLARVFDRFYRVDKARSREQGGAGLGLSIAQSIVAAHGGRIDLASAPGQGTICTVILRRIRKKDEG